MTKVISGTDINRTNSYTNPTTSVAATFLPTIQWEVKHYVAIFVLRRKANCST